MRKKNGKAAEGGEGVGGRHNDQNAEKYIKGDEQKKKYRQIKKNTNIIQMKKKEKVENGNEKKIRDPQK